MITNLAHYLDCHCEKRSDEAINLESKLDCRGRRSLPRNDKQREFINSGLGNRFHCSGEAGDPPYNANWMTAAQR